MESEYGEGSEFSFELSQEIIDDEPIGDFAERLKKNTDKNEAGKYLFAIDAKILVVDDNDMNRKVARSLMKRNGIVPDEASSGQQAIGMLAGKKYDIISLEKAAGKGDSAYIKEEYPKFLSQYVKTADTIKQIFGVE